MVILDPDLDFLLIPDPVSRGQKGTGSQFRNAACKEKVMRLLVTSTSKKRLASWETLFIPTKS